MEHVFELNGNVLVERVSASCGTCLCLMLMDASAYFVSMLNKWVTAPDDILDIGLD